MNTLCKRLRGKIYFHALSQVLLQFELENVSYALLKGEALSMFAYGGVARREYNDVDILVEKKDLTRVDSILKLNEFEQYNIDMKRASRKEIVSCILNSHQTIPYSKSVQPYNIIMEVDINIDVLWGEYEGKRISVNKFLESTEFIEIYGIPIRVLSPKFAFVQLLLHHYKDFNSIYVLATRNSINRKRFEEIYFFWRKQKYNIQLEWLIEFAEEEQIRDYIYYVLYYTNQIYQDRELQIYIDALKTKSGVELLEYYGLSEKERHRWNIDFQTRLDSTEIYSFIKNDFTEEDLKKIEYNLSLF